MGFFTQIKTRRYRNWAFIAFVTVLLLPFQNCVNSTFTGEPPKPDSQNISGNGEPYDGLRSIDAEVFSSESYEFIGSQNTLNYVVYEEGLQCNGASGTINSYAGILTQINNQLTYFANSCDMNGQSLSESLQDLSNAYNEKSALYSQRPFLEENKLNDHRNQGLKPFMLCRSETNNLTGLDFSIYEATTTNPLPAPAAFDVQITENFNVGSRADLTFTRDDGGLSVASFYNANGILVKAADGELRLGYHPVTGEFLGALLEGSSTNRIQNSEDLSSYTASSLNLNNVVAPDGTTTADTIVDNNPNQVVNLNLNIPGTSNPYPEVALSFFVKADQTNGYTITVTDESGAIVSTITGQSDGSITYTGNGSILLNENLRQNWKRIGLRFAPSNPAGPLTLGIQPASSNASATGSLTLWGLQLEYNFLGAQVTSYMATNGSEVSRGHDVLASINTNWFNTQAEGSWYFEWMIPSNHWNVDHHIFRDLNRTIWIEVDNNNNLNVQLNAADIYFINNGGNMFYQNQRTFFKYGNGEFKLFHNGQLLDTDNISGTPLVMDSFYIGGESSNEKINGYVKRVSYWPNALTDDAGTGITQSARDNKPYFVQIHRGLGPNGANQLNRLETDFYALDYRNGVFGSDIFYIRLDSPLAANNEARASVTINNETTEANMRCFRP